MVFMLPMEFLAPFSDDEEVDLVIQWQLPICFMDGNAGCRCSYVSHRQGGSLALPPLKVGHEWLYRQDAG